MNRRDAALNHGRKRRLALGGSGLWLCGAICLMLFVMVGCTQSTPTAALPPATATSVPPTAAPTSTPSLTLPPTSTATDAATSTPRPTRTPRPTATPITEGETWPNPRADYGLAYDAESDRVVMVGGWNTIMRSGFKAVFGVWAYDLATNAWEYKGEYPGRDHTGHICYHAKADRVIVVEWDGGQTWAYDLNTNGWEKRARIDTSESLGAGGLVYDSESDRIVLFGGCLGWNVNVSDETWAYDYNQDSWTKMAPEVSPQGRCGHAMAYDAESDRTIMWGGHFYITEHDVEACRQMVWAYDYNTDSWTASLTSGGPDVCLGGFGMAYDPAIDRVVVFGGDTGETPVRFSGETWNYDYNSNTWALRDPSAAPPGRRAHNMIYHSGAGKLLLFGGQLDEPRQITNDLWLYDGRENAWAEVMPEE